MYVVDASVWVSRFVSDDANHQTSYDWLRMQLESNEVVVSPAILLAEVGGAISRRTADHIFGLQAVASMQRLPHLQLTEIDMSLAALSARVAVNSRLRGMDAVYVALAQSLSIPLITLDREQIERGRDAATVFTPDDATS